jgi:hypothetical protein
MIRPTPFSTVLDGWMRESAREGAHEPGMIFVTPGTMSIASQSLARLGPRRPAVRGERVEQEGAAARRRYRRAIMALTRSGYPFLVGGAYALEHYTTIARWTKDLDIFVLPANVDGCLKTLAAAGFETEVAFPHWLAKAYAGRDFIDLIFNSGNGIAQVDEQWMAHAVPGRVLGLPVPLCPAEEMIWSKAFVAERERYDGADIAHLVRACHAQLDWDRLVGRFGAHWRVLLSHLLLFEFVYPSEPAPEARRWARVLARKLEDAEDAPEAAERICRGTLLSRAQYLPDITDWGYADARQRPHGPMSEEAVQRWTDAIDEHEEGTHAHRGGR